MARDQPHHTPATVHAPAQGRQKEEQAGPPPQKKKQGGGAQKQPTATKPPANNTKGGQTPHPEGTEDGTPKEAQGDLPAKTGNTKPGTAAHRDKGHRNMQTHTTKKKKASSPAREKGDRGTDHKAWDRDTQQPTPQSRKKNAQKTHPDNPAKKGGAQPRPGPSTHAHTAHGSQKRREASETRTKPHTSQKQAET